MDTTALIVMKSSRIRAKQFALMVAQSLEQSLRQLKIDASIVAEEEGGEADWIFGLWDANLNLRRFDYQIAVHVPSEQLPYYKGAPQPVLNRWYAMKQHIPKYDFIFEHSLPQVDFLRTYGEPKRGPTGVVHFPWGYSTKMDYAKCGMRQHGPVARSLRRVHFLGGMTPRRRQIVDELRKDFAVSTDPSYARPGQMVRKAAISLNLHNEERGAFAAGRVVGLLLGNGAFVITEPFEKEEELPFRDGKHLVVAKHLKEMKEKIVYYLENREERLCIARQGYAYVKKHYTMTQNLRRALQEARLMTGGK